MTHRAASTLLIESMDRLRAYAPFDAMAAADLRALVEASELVYFAPHQVVIAPRDGLPSACWIVREGVLAQKDAQGELVSVWSEGDALPVGALLAGRAVSVPVVAQRDTFCWRVPAARFHDLVGQSEPLRRYCQDRLASLNQASRRALQAEVSQRVVQERLMERPVIELIRRPPVQVDADASLALVFQQMEEQQVGSVIVGSAQGIFTRQDVIGRVALPGLSLQTPVSQVMSSPLITLEPHASVAQAMLTMAEHGIRHLALMDHDGLRGVVTERDLFSLQRQGLSSLSAGIRTAQSLPVLAESARGIRDWAGLLVAQGVQPAFMTALISRLNDQLTRRLIALRAQAFGLPMHQACWLALGSEGREEQTMATDQDNALILPDGLAGHSLEQWLSFARAVNDDLDACGFPLCKGGVMASNAQWCLEHSQWIARFSQWIEQGHPSALLNACIFFDFRPLAGDFGLAHDLRTQVVERARTTPRFLKRMSDNALRNGPPRGLAASALGSWLPGAQDEVLDLKLHGTMPLVDGARLLALAHGVEATGTDARLKALAAAEVICADEQSDWAGAFEFFQTLRLRSQHQNGQSADALPANCVRMSELSAIEQRGLRESWRQMRRMQQRLALDYPG
jgi:CBS domain-containing protein